MDFIDPDKKIFEDLYQQEQLGEEGFMTYLQGDQKEGEKKIKEAMLATSRDLTAIQDQTLKEETEKLFNMMKETLKYYMEDPNEYNIRLLKYNFDAYKQYIDIHQR